MQRQKFPSLTGGLSTKTSSLVGNLGSAVASYDTMLIHDILEQRFGSRVLDIEPSHVNDAGGTTKTRTTLRFDGVNDYATNAAWTQTLGTQWTIRLWSFAVTISGINDTDGTRTLLDIAAAGHHPVLLQMVGVTLGGTCQLKAIVKDAAGSVVTLTGTARTSAAWITLLGQHGVADIRLVRNGATVSMYIGENLEATSTSFTTALHEVATTLWVAASSGPGAGTYAQMHMMGLAIVNRTLTEGETYWGIGWPTDQQAETDVLGNWLLTETTGTTLTDRSTYTKDLTVTGATWNGTSVCNARGLGVFTHRVRSGTRYYAIACGRRGTSSAAASPSGVVYIWQATRAFTPFYFGGDSANDDATATITGLDYLSRVQFISVGDLLYMGNGVDYARKYGGTTPAARYWGMTAPPVGPVVTMAGAGGALSAGVYLYCYTYYNANTGTESGRSPTVASTAVATDSATVDLFYSSDPQVTHIRVYRTQANGTTFNLLVQAEVPNLPTATFADTFADTKIVGNLTLPGADASGNGRVKRLYLQGGPPTAPTLAVAAGGGVNAGVHYYAYSWYNPTTGLETGMSPAAAATTAAGNLTVNLSVMDLPDQSAGYTQIRIYRTKAGVREWFLLTTITAATTHSDTAADSTLTATIETRALPPKCKYGVLCANRHILFGDTANPSTMYVSTAGDHENFPWLNAHIANAGSEITGGCAVGDTLFYLHHNDNRIYGMPHPGSETDTNLFLVLNMREVSPKGAAVSHWSIQTTENGTVWLSRDGFRIVRGGALADAAPTISPEFLNLNRVRAKYAVSLYLEDVKMYLCWMSRGNNRLNEEAFVLDFEKGTWAIWQVHADAAGILTDANEQPHYCYLVENGILLEFDTTSAKDGDGSGTLSATLVSPTLVEFADVSGRTAPTGGDGGYPIWLIKSDGTAVQRYKLDPAIDERGDADNVELFYPSYSGITSGSWIAYFHGIRLQWQSMFSQFGDSRPDKTFNSAYVYHGKESAGTVRLRVATDEGSLAASHGVSFSLAEDMTSQVALQAAGRCLQLEFTHDPPSAGEKVRLVEVEVEGDMAGDTP